MEYKKKNKITHVLIGCTVGTLLTMVGIGSYEAGQERKFRLNYEQRIMPLADTNKDGILTHQEKDILEEKLYAGKNVTKLPGKLPTYENGQTVESETLEQWIKNYETPKTPKKEPTQLEKVLRAIERPWKY